jgi:hypothetical protein
VNRRARPDGELAGSHSPHPVMIAWPSSRGYRAVARSPRRNSRGFPHENVNRVGTNSGRRLLSRLVNHTQFVAMYRNDLYLLKNLCEVHHNSPTRTETTPFTASRLRRGAEGINHNKNNAICFGRTDAPTHRFFVRFSWLTTLRYPPMIQVLTRSGFGLRFVRFDSSWFFPLFG